MIRVARHRVRHPAVMMLRGVQRLARVADEMTHHAHDVDDVLLGVGNFCGRAAVIFKRGERAETGLQLLEIFIDGPRQKTGQLARVVGVFRRINRGETFGMFQPRLRDGGGELITKRRQRGGRQVIFGNLFEVEIMIRPAAMAEFQAALGLGFHVRDVAPAVGLAREKRDAVARGGFEDERWKICGQRRQREFVHRAVTFVIPGVGIQRKRAEREDGGNNFFIHNLFPCLQFTLAKRAGIATAIPPRTKAVCSLPRVRA